MASTLAVDSDYQTLRWNGGVDGLLELLDQTLLPGEVRYIPCPDIETLFEAIRALRVRGAPAIGVAAAYGVIVGMQRAVDLNETDYFAHLDRTCRYLATSRPTAVNLFWALDRMRNTAEALRGTLPLGPLAQRLLDEARAIDAEDQAMCRAIGDHGAALLADGDGVLTHCNAGALATAGDGTALALLYAAHAQGKRLTVFAGETRPLLQGARLTAFELHRRGLDVTVICDNMAAQVMREGRIQAVVVGADRIAANGDAANKIGTYGVAVAAAAHGVPFYVAAPTSTFDLSLPTGDEIPIEQRDPREVTHGFGRQTAPDGVKVYNPAFDVTPARLIRAIICERGIISPVDAEAIRRTAGMSAPTGPSR
jgi:methylthioribose-1-phosphate isomerase